MMNKLILTAVCAVLMCAGGARAADCANGAGTVITGVDGTPYCKSNTKMNWWSANAWCDGISMKLISLSECNKSTGTAACPNLKGVGASEYVWTRSVKDGSDAYGVTLSSGVVGNNLRNNDGCALCVASSAF